MHSYLLGIAILINVDILPINYKMPSFEELLSTFLVYNTYSPYYIIDFYLISIYCEINLKPDNIFEKPARNKVR